MKEIQGKENWSIKAVVSVLMSIPIFWLNYVLTKKNLWGLECICFLNKITLPAKKKIK